MGAKLDRVGEKGVSNEGYSMEIIAYRNANDIDVLVDGKYLRENRTYGNFKKGSITANFKGMRVDRIGEKRINNEGYTMEIVEYRGSNDIDVLVDGKYLRKNLRYLDFETGGISVDSRGRRIDRVGEKIINNEGQTMEIVAYRNSHDIDVLVDGKYLRKSRGYEDFKRGSIAAFSDGVREDRLGEKRKNNEGSTMEIVAYRNTQDIDVLVDGKYLRENRTYGEFTKGTIASIDGGVRLDRVGEKGVSNEGYSMEIVAYRGVYDIDILIDGHYLAKGTRYASFKKGAIGNPYHRSIYGLGYMGVGEYKGSIDRKETDMYSKWVGMFKRSYDKRYLARSPTYTGCTVDERFHNFQDYGVWYDENYYTVGSERMEMDKDIFIKGNKVYSPDTCLIVPQRINSLVIGSRDRLRVKYPVGVFKDGRRYRAYLHKKEACLALGTFDTPEEAFLAYKTAKEAYIKQVADEYKGKIPQKLYDALYAYTIEITD